MQLLNRSRPQPQLASARPAGAQRLPLRYVAARASSYQAVNSAVVQQTVGYHTGLIPTGLQSAFYDRFACAQDAEASDLLASSSEPAELNPPSQVVNVEPTELQPIAPAVLSAKAREIRAALLDSLYGTERGLTARSEVRAEINELINQLETFSSNDMVSRCWNLTSMVLASAWAAWYPVHCNTHPGRPQDSDLRPIHVTSHFPMHTQLCMGKWLVKWIGLGQASPEASPEPASITCCPCCTACRPASLCLLSFVDCLRSLYK